MTSNKQVTPRRHRTRWIQRWFWLPLLVGAAIFAAQYLALQERSLLDVGWGPIVEVDLNQQRANVMLPVPRGDVAIQQTFVPRWDNLREIELLIVQTEADAAGDGRFRLQLLDDNNVLLAEQDLTSAMFVDGQVHRFRFAPQPDAKGRTYTLVISGSDTNTATVRGYSLDVVANGRVALAVGPLSDDAPPPAPAQDLRLVTRYELGWWQALTAVGSVLYFDGLYLLLALAFLPLPGVIALLAGPAAWRRWDPLAWAGVALALGISLWALLWSALTLVGGRMTGWLLWTLFAGGWLAAGVLWWRGRLPAGAWRSRWRWAHLWLVAVVVLGFVVRLLAVRHINVLPWVDAGRHGLITAVMAQTGQIIRDYADFLAVDRFPYHFGFHTLSASLHLMTGWELNYMLLYLGQLLNGLAALAVYTAVWLTTRQSKTGVIAALLVALPFFFPGYYAAWGRLTQLTAMLILPVLLGLTWQLVRGTAVWRQVWWLVGVLAAGVFLVHFRVFLYFVPFVVVVWAISLGRRVIYLAGAALLGGLLVVWRIFALSATTNSAVIFNNSIPNYNAFPVDYLTTGWERPFVYLAGAALLVVVVGRLWRRRWSVWPTALFVWVSLLFILMAGDRLGLPQTDVVNINSMYITLFAPLAMVLAGTAVALLRWLGRLHWLALLLGWLEVGFLLAAAVVFGVRYQIDMMNPQTVLVQPEDVVAIDWLDANLPADAKLAVNSWLWLGNTWSSSDGGLWIVPLTKRTTTTPPADYIYSPVLRQQVAAFNTAATAVADWSDSGTIDWLRANDVTHLFVGAKGGFMDPAALAANPGLEMIYGRGGVFIFAIKN